MAKQLISIRNGVRPRVYLLVIGLILLAQTAWSQSFRDLVSDAQPNGITASLSKTCLVALRDHIRKNHSFRASSLRPYLTPVSSLSGERGRAPVLFHYTTSKEVVEVSRSKDFKSIFNFLRKPSRTDPMRWHLYLAGDTESSRGYGPYQMMLAVNPKTFVYDPLLKIDDENARAKSEVKSRMIVETKRRANAEIENELMRRYSDIADCVLSPAQQASEHAEDNSILVLLALEESKVSLISYYGLRAPQDRLPSGRPYYWFALLNSSHILDMTLGSGAVR